MTGKSFKLSNLKLLVSPIFITTILLSLPSALLSAPKQKAQLPKIQIYTNQYTPNAGWEYNQYSKNADYYVGFDSDAPGFPNIGGAAIIANIGCNAMGGKRFHLYFTGMGSMYNNQVRLIHGNYARILNTSGNLILLDNNNVPLGRYTLGPNDQRESVKLVSQQLTPAQLDSFNQAKSIIIDTPRIGGTITAKNLAQIIPILKETNCD